MVKLKIVNVRVPPDLHAFVVREAGREMMTISTWVCRVLAKMMTEDKTQPTDKGKRGRSAA